MEIYQKPVTDRCFCLEADFYHRLYKTARCVFLDLFLGPGEHFLVQLWYIKKKRQEKHLCRGTWWDALCTLVCRLSTVTTIWCSPGACSELKKIHVMKKFRTLQVLEDISCTPKHADWSAHATGGVRYANAIDRFTFEFYVFAYLSYRDRISACTVRARTTCVNIAEILGSLLIIRSIYVTPTSFFETTP